MTALLRRTTVADLLARRCPAVDPGALQTARSIVEDVERRGEAGVREYARTLDGLTGREPLFIERAALTAALDALAPPDRERLERVTGRIRTFAEAQLGAITDLSVVIPGGSAGHIDALAGPSEIAILADETSDAALVAADLLAQAEHDPRAQAILITLDARRIERVEEELRRQLADLPTAEVARAALGNGGVVVVDTIEQAIAACDHLAPEHVEVLTRDPDATAARLTRFGTLFVGPGAGEVLGDYGAGPNHVLPTGGSARSAAGLSVFAFLRARTWLSGTGPADPLLAADAAWLARLERLEAHARAAERRRVPNAR